MCSSEKEGYKTTSEKVTETATLENNYFWHTIRNFITNKNELPQNNTMLIYNNTIATDEKQLATIFNNHYVNIIAKCTGVKRCSINYEKVTCENVNGSKHA